MPLLRVLLAMLLGLAMAPLPALAAVRSDGRTFWEEKRRDYPQCNGYTDQHERLTDELERLDDLAHAAKEPQRAAYVRQINATAKQRNTVQDQLFACIRASGGNPTPSGGATQKPRPPLQGRVEETDQPQKPPPGDPGPTGPPPMPGPPSGPSIPGGLPPGGGSGIPGGPAQDPPPQRPSGPATPPPCSDPRVAQQSAALGGDPVYLSAQQVLAIQRQEPGRLRACIVDICNRPNGRVCWLNQEARTQPVPPGRPDVGRPDGGDLPGDVRAGLQQRAQELRAVKNGPTAGGEFLRGATDFLIEMLEFLAQPRGGFGDFGAPAKQLLGYLANHKPESHVQRYKNALKAVDDFKKNPAYALGKAAPGAVAAAAGLKAQYARELEVASQEILAANNTAKRIVSLEQEAANAARAGGRGGFPPTKPPATSPPPTTGGGGSRPPNRAPDPGLPPSETPVPRDPTTLPPSCTFNQCLEDSIAVYKWQQTGQWVPPKLRGPDVPAPQATVQRRLKEIAGGERAVDPLHGQGGQQIHAEGIPVVSSREKIDDVMRQLGPNGRGLVFFDKEWLDEAGRLRTAGHIANVSGSPNGAVYYDRGMGGPPHPLEWGYAKRIYFMRLP